MGIRVGVYGCRNGDGAYDVVYLSCNLPIMGPITTSQSERYFRYQCGAPIVDL